MVVGGQGRTGRSRRVVVIGAGIVGLSTAWFLQEHGVEVTVVERREVASGASWGNAGWLSPGLAIPLNEPGVVRYGLRSLLDPDAPLYVPPSLDPALWTFLTRFTAHCRWRDWERAVRANRPLNEECLAAFDELTIGGVDDRTTAAPITALFTSERGAVRLADEFDRISALGLPIAATALSADAVAEQVPQASSAIRAGLQIHDQRFVDPGRFVHALADSVRARGGKITEHCAVTGLRRDKASLSLRSGDEVVESADAVVVATGAWLGRHSRRWGVRVPLSAGRGYSLTVPADGPVSGPVYLPEVRVACTPYRGGMRIAGTMEFRHADAPLDHARIRAIVRSARPLLDGLDWSGRTDEWVGARPVTADGRPLVGRTSVPGLYVAGGHGMWGLSHGPATAHLLARQITTGETPDELRACNPLR